MCDTNYLSTNLNQEETKIATMKKTLETEQENANK